MGDADHALAAGEPPTGLLRALIDQVSDLVVLSDRVGTIAWANVGFVEATGFVSGSLASSLLAFTPSGPSGTRARLALGEMLASPPREAAGVELLRKDGSAVRVDARVQSIGAQLLWTLHDVTREHELSQQASRQRELLQTTQEFGRLGIWERAIPSGAGRWDAHVFGFWGLDPQSQTPTHEAAVERIHPEDRPRMNYIDSTKRAGRYAERFRVIRPDGSMRWIHSQWEVKNGIHGVPDRAVGVVLDDTESYEAARALLGANTQLQMAVELGKISIWRHDLRTDRMFCSEHGFELLGMPARPEGHRADEVRSYIHPDDLPAVLTSAHAALKSGEPIDVETRYRRSDGSWRYVLTRRVVERDDGGRPIAFLGVALDMTERLENLRHAEELARRLDAASRAAGVGIWTMTLEPRHSDWNEQMFVLFDHFTPPEVPTFGRWLAESLHPDDMERIGQTARDFLVHGEGAFEIEFRTLRRDGNTRWIVMRAHVDGNARAPRRVLGVAMDVTERHEALDALREASRRAAFITHQAGIGTWESNVAGDGERWDERMFELRGLPPGDRVPNREERMAMVHPDDVPHVVESRRRGEAGEIGRAHV